MESDTSLTTSTVSNFLLRFSRRNSPNGCSPRGCCRQYGSLGAGGEKKLALFRPAYYSCLTARNQSAPTIQYARTTPEVSRRRTRSDGYLVLPPLSAPIPSLG